MSESSEQTSTAHPGKARKFGLIVMSAISIGTIAGLLLMPIIFGEPDESKVSDIVRFVGRFHPVVLHLPIGMLSLVVILEVLNILPLIKNKFNTTLMLFFSALTAVVATVFGFMLYMGGGYEGETATDHLWGGIIFACVVIAAFLLKLWSTYRVSFRRLAIPTLFAAMIIMTVAAHEGANMTHGSGYLTKYMPRELQSTLAGFGLMEKPEEPSEEDDLVVLSPAEKPVYETIIHPILEEKCISCHGEDKQKGKLRMDSIEALVKGGAEGPSLVKGDSQKSLMMVRIHLPLDDEDEEHMPPKGKTQLTEEEIAILDWWVDAGAPVEESVVELNAPENIITAVNAMLSPEELSALKKKQEEDKTLELATKESKRKDLEVAMAELQKEFPGALNFVSRKSTDLTFTAVSLRKSFTDDHLVKLAPVSEELVYLDLSATSVTDKAGEMLRQMTKLNNLKLSETAITDELISSIIQLSQLESLNLYGTQVTDKGAKRLIDLTNLKSLYLWNSKVTADGAAALRKAMPNTTIQLGAE